ncbi:DrmE family protein [Haloarcula sediminis]|uniref:DrmE family protein n=1 Tax=Haloarcula sediminis TaxID=3111777 RepID=UPI002D798B79|nr:DrmE family protein [Haloarcula sp. CK38]
MAVDGPSNQGDLISIDDSAAPVLVTDEMGRLHYNNKEVALTRFDRSYVAAAAAAQQKNRDLALVYPSAPTYLQLPVLLAVGYQNRSPPPVLFVSNRSGKGIRDQYFNVGIADLAPGAPVNSLADATAPLLKTGDGRNLSYITHHKPRNWNGGHEGISVVHATLGKKIASDFPSEKELPLSTIILDLTTKLLDDFTIIKKYQRAAQERGISIQYIFDTPSHPHLEQLEEQNADRPESEQTLIWGFDESTMQSAGKGLLDIASQKSGFDTAAITSSTVDSSSPFEASIPVIKNLINGVERNTISLTYSDLQPVSTEAYEDIRKVAGYVLNKRSEFPQSVGRAMRDLYFTYNYLSMLPTSIDFHDEVMAFDRGWGAGSTIDQMIQNVRDNYADVESDITGAGNMLENACDSLSTMRSELVERNPKADQILEEIGQAIESDESMVVLTATTRQTSLLRSFVTEKGGIRGSELDEAGVEFHSMYNTHTIPAASRLLFPGVPSKSHRPAVLSGTAPQQTYIVYKWEQERLQYWLRELKNQAKYRCGPGTLRHTAEQLDVDYSNLQNYIQLPDSGHPPVPKPVSTEPETDTGGSNSDQDISNTTKRGVGGQKSSSVGASDSAVEADSEIDRESFRPDTDAMQNPAEYFDDGSEQESVNEGRETVPGDGGNVDAVKITLSDGMYILERPRGQLWVYDESQTGKKRRTRRAASSLESGDIILITEQESRRDIFEHIVEKIRAEVPEFKKYSKMLEYWRTNLERIVSDEGRSAQRISADLDAYADAHNKPEVTRTYHAIRDWVVGDSIGPSNHAVIKALGDIYDVEIFKEMSVEIQASLDEIRKLHRRVGHHLEKILFDASSADGGDEWLFEEFNIRVSDVQDAIEYREVEEVGNGAQKVTSRNLGRLFHQTG